MAISIGFPSQVVNLIQDNVLEREFHDALYVDDQRCQEILDRYTPTTAVTRSPTTMITNDFRQFAFDLRMLAAHLSVGFGLGQLPRGAILSREIIHHHDAVCT